jgi:hypothetical protein
MNEEKKAGITCKIKQWTYSQTFVQRPPLGPEKRGRYAEVYMKKISGK